MIEFLLNNLDHMAPIIGLGIFVWGCGGSTSGDALEKLFQSRDVWRAQQLQSYSYEYQQICFCPFSGETFRVIVRDNVVVDAVSLNTGAHVMELDQFSTIDELFDYLENALDENPSQFEAAYDLQLGYPRLVSFDRSSLAADDEFSFSAENLSSGEF